MNAFVFMFLWKQRKRKAALEQNNILKKIKNRM